MFRILLRNGRRQEEEGLVWRWRREEVFSKGGPVQSFRLDKPSSGSVRKLIIQNYLHLTFKILPIFSEFKYRKKKQFE